MKKLLLTVFAIACVSIASHAQFSVGAELAMPMGDFGDVSGIGFGASARYEGALGSGNLAYTATVGYVTFSEKDNSGFKINLIPVLGGLKYYFTESGSGFYGIAEAGLFFASGDVEIGGVKGELSGNEFGFAPGVGYKFGNIDIGAKYTIIGSDAVDFNSFGVRAAYVFGGK